MHAIQLRFPWMCLGVTLPSAARSSSLASSFLEGSVLTIDTTTEQVCAAQLLPPLPALLAVF